MCWPLAVPCRNIFWHVNIDVDVLAGPDRFDEAVDYIEKYQLYEAGLGIWKGSDRYEVRLRCDAQ